MNESIDQEHSKIFAFQHFCHGQCPEVVAYDSFVAEQNNSRYRKVRNQKKFDLSPPVTKRSFVYIAVIVLGSVLVGTGTNLVLFRTGLRDNPSIDVTATIRGCGEIGMCVASYERGGQTLEATYFLDGGDPPTEGSKVEAVVYPGHPERLYTSKNVSIWISVVFVTLGSVLIVVFGVKLYRHWRGEFKASREPVKTNAKKSS